METLTNKCMKDSFNFKQDYINNFFRIHQFKIPMKNLYLHTIDYFLSKTCLNVVLRFLKQTRLRFGTAKLLDMYLTAKKSNITLKINT